VMVQGVMGVESNRGTLVAKISGPTWNAVLNDSDNLISSYKASAKDDLTAIGRSWKFFDNGSFKWYLADTQSFMIKSVRGADSVYWLIHFTGVTGSGSGKSVFTKVLLGKTNAVFAPNLGNISVYPNPASQMVYVSIENSAIASGNIIIRDLAGRTVAKSIIGGNSNFQASGIPVAGVASGTYVLSIESGTSTYSQKIVIQ
jgi:Secretion system C-terminal sorting domain